MELFDTIKKDFLNGVDIDVKYNRFINTFDKKLNFKYNNFIKYIGFNNNNIDYSSIYLLNNYKLIEKNNEINYMYNKFNKKQLNYLILKEDKIKEINIINEYILIIFNNIIKMNKLKKKQEKKKLLSSSDDDIDDIDDIDDNDIILIYKKENNYIKNFYMNIKEIFKQNGILSSLFCLKNNDLYNLFRCKKRYNYYTRLNNNYNII